MKVVRLHPKGMPETERYTMSTAWVRNYALGPDQDGAITYGPAYEVDCL